MAAEIELPAAAGGEEVEDEEDGGSWGDMFVNMYYALVNLGIMLGSIGLMMVAYWLLKWATCRDCCCNSCNKGSSYCAFPRFTGEDIGDETRNFIFWMAGTGFINFCLSYSIWANYGSPRMFLLFPCLASSGLLATMGLKMKWLLCHPVEKPQNNLANWISMDALDTEHGRVALFAIAAYMALLSLDFCVSMMCCCCIEVIEDDDEQHVDTAKSKTD